MHDCFICMTVCVPNSHLAAHEGQKRARDPLELELLVTSCVHAWWESHQSSARAASALISPPGFFSTLPFFLSISKCVSLHRIYKRHTRLYTMKDMGQKIMCHQYLFQLSFNAKSQKWPLVCHPSQSLNERQLWPPEGVTLNGLSYFLILSQSRLSTHCTLVALYQNLKLTPYGWILPWDTAAGLDCV